jgi:hypothetical protein
MPAGAAATIQDALAKSDIHIALANPLLQI